MSCMKCNIGSEASEAQKHLAESGFPTTVTQDSVWTNFEILAHQSITEGHLRSTGKVSTPAANVDNQELFSIFGSLKLGLQERIMTNIFFFPLKLS